MEEQTQQETAEAQQLSREEIVKRLKIDFSVADNGNIYREVYLENTGGVGIVAVRYELGRVVNPQEPEVIYDRNNLNQVVHAEQLRRKLVEMGLEPTPFKLTAEANDSRIKIMRAFETLFEGVARFFEQKGIRQ